MEHTKNARITSEIRDTALRLSCAGLKASEIANILNISPSSASYIVQSYKVAEMEDWENLRRIARSQPGSVRWALEKLGKTLPNEVYTEPACVEVPNSPTVNESEMLVMYESIVKSLNNVEYLLSEILAELRV
jgi:hypothetical protein